MRKIWLNYKTTIILLLSIVIGAIVGITFKEKAAALSPFGDMFLNFMFVIIVPLIFVTISTSIAKMSHPRRLGKILSSIVFIFVVTSLIAVAVGLLSTYFIKLVDTNDSELIKQELMKDTSVEETTIEELSILERTVKLLTVNDFPKLLSRDNLMALLIMSVLIGVAINMSGSAGKPMLDFLNSANAVLMNLIKIIMYYAPIGIGCYFASLVGTFGNEIAVGYAKTFIIYTVVAVLFYAIVYSVYAFIGGGVDGVKIYWKNVVSPTVTALATCSSAATIPSNIAAVREMGVSDDIAETLVPLGTSFHKDGSIIGSVFKIMFLVALFGTDISGIGILKVLVVAVIANLLVSAVPIGGGTISEMMIITLMGYPIYALPILTIIATIIDPPATVLNVIGDTSASLIVSKLVDGKVDE